MDTKDDLDILTALLDEDGDVIEEQEQEGDDDLEGVSDEDEDGEEIKDQEEDNEGNKGEDGGMSEEQEDYDFEGFFNEDDEDEGASEEPEQESGVEGLCGEDEDRGVSKEQEQQDDDLDGLFDEDDEDEEYTEGIEGEVLAREVVVAELFGDVDDIEKEEKADDGGENLNRSKEELQETLRHMQEQMKKLQEQLNEKEKVLASSSIKGDKGLKRVAPTAAPPPSKQAGSLRSKSQAATAGLSRLQESSDFSSQLNNADAFKRKPRVAHPPKAASSSESRGALMEIKISSSFQPDSKAAPVRSPPAPPSRPAASAGRPKPAPLPPPPKDVAVEKYSGLRLRKPRVSSIEMDHKMAGRRLIRLSQVPERLTREKLEDSDWVTFGVLVNKATPQSNRSGKTFSIWKLNDLHNLDVSVSLLLFGEVHKEHWKLEPGTVIGLLNPNPMKQKDGYEGVSLTVDHPQKVLVLGEAQDYGTCKGVKKNGEPCSHIVNMYECQYCQYHVQAQYKKMSSKRAELQSSFSGKAPNALKGKGGGLRQRLCQDGFYYGGVSSSACATALTASRPGKPQQKTLEQLFVNGSAQLVRRAKQIAMQSGEVSGCSTEFKSLMSLPTPGALQLKRHLARSSQSVSKGPAGAPLQSISASELLKQQKQRQRELQEIQRRRANERLQQKSSGASTSPQTPGGVVSPLKASDAPKTPAVPPTPTLGRGFSVGDDILFFDGCPPPAASSSLSAAKLAALRKLRAKGAGLEKEDPNALKRKRSNNSEISARVEKNRSSPKENVSAEDEEPAQKKKRDQLRYIQSEEFQKILNAKSRHEIVLQAAEYQLQERYFDALVKKEQMEEKMKGIKEMKCRAVTCKKCSYTYFKPADRCVQESHDLRWHDAVKRFFRCPCGQRAIALDRLPHKHCSNCGLFKWERDGMLKEKTGPKIGAELLQPRGEEHAKFINSLK
ncbi:protein MCM10 homolog [Oryzias melastigma]|uniref:Protein MCM10 homolog n=1 Tax=Oryzias melastigma TaxID=30732 RepID=A0A3B3DID6_ORYME|nr:protein MCM10 homolog [Oryzias melastigma]XP_024118395.1 protein MCM10 homolog [Oryzias melastigma]